MTVRFFFSFCLLFLGVGFLQAQINEGDMVTGLWVNKASVDVPARAFRFTVYKNEKAYQKKKPLDLGNGGIDDPEDMKMENTIFAPVLNQVLAEMGLVDTTAKVIKGTYANNLKLNATITGMSVTVVDDNSAPSHWVNLKIDWELLDFYETPIGTFSTKATGKRIRPKDMDGPFMFDATKTAVEKNLDRLLEQADFKKVMKEGPAVDVVEEDLVLTTGDKYVSSVAEAVASSVTIKNENSHGSGFAVSSDGLIVTNHHVIANMEDPIVVLNDGTEHPATVLRSSKVYDLALVKIEKDDFVPFRMNAERDIPVATDIYVIGTPRTAEFGQTISRGIISGLRVSPNEGKLIQTDASINGGNSGGPMLLKNGTLIGVTSSKVRGIGLEGLGFGIPAYELLDQLRLKQ